MKKAGALGALMALSLLGTLVWGNVWGNSSFLNESDRLSELNEKQRKTVEKLYRKWYSRPLHYLLTSGRGSSRIYSRWWAKAGISRFYIPRFIRNNNINVNEISQPVKSFKSFNDFFIRKLKPSARPLPTDPTAIISPADGSAFVIPHINGSTLFPIKAVSFSAQKMLQDEELANKFKGGTAVIIRLAPWDYHRVHFPLDGTPSTAKTISGRFESVSPAAYEAGVQPLEVNERHIIQLRSDKASTVAIVLVGALFVGAIKETYTPGTKQLQGDEIGYFEYGGSTMVMLFQKDTVTINQNLIDASAQGKETPVKMGEIIGHVIPE